jgi:hypothetical protein
VPGPTKYPREWLEQVPAAVFARLNNAEVRILLHPGNGLAEGGAPRDIPIEQIPVELRMPNTLLWVQLDDDMRIARVWKRDP